MQYATEYIHFKLCKNKKLINDKRRYGTYLSTVYEHVLPFADPPLPCYTYVLNGWPRCICTHTSFLLSGFPLWRELLAYSGDPFPFIPLNPCHHPLIHHLFTKRSLSWSFSVPCSPLLQSGCVYCAPVVLWKIGRVGSCSFGA